MTLRNLFLSAAIVVGASSISFSSSANEPFIAEMVVLEPYVPQLIVMYLEGIVLRMQPLMLTWMRMHVVTSCLKVLCWLTTLVEINLYLNVRPISGWYNVWLL